jgi:hypothetical protein
MNHEGIGTDVWFLVATSLATEKISVATKLATQLQIMNANIMI